MAHPGAELSVLSGMTPRRDHHDPHGVLAEYAGPGRTVRLEGMETFLSYAGLLEGRPVVEMNADVIAGLVEQYRRDGQDPQVVCDAADVSDPMHPLLPPIVSVLELVSDEAVHDAKADGATMTLIWLHTRRDVNAGEALRAVAERAQWERFGWDYLV